MTFTDTLRAERTALVSTRNGSSDLPTIRRCNRRIRQINTALANLTA